MLERFLIPRLIGVGATRGGIGPPVADTPQLYGNFPVGGCRLGFVLQAEGDIAGRGSGRQETGDRCRGKHRYRARGGHGVEKRRAIRGTRTQKNEGKN